MRISVVIPTYNRIDDLAECLNSLIIQSFLPYEVIIVDNSHKCREKVKEVVERFKHLFSRKRILLKYVCNDKENSLTVAKNIGVKISSGDLISFLDDDVVLYKDYYKEIVNVFKKYSSALGVEGKVIFKKQSKCSIVFTQIIGRLFYLGFLEKSKCRVLPSLGVTYPEDSKIINCQWVSGASVFKRELFKEFSCDENLKKYSDGEDLDFSYRIFKKYPQSLFFTPYAKYIHKESSAGRASDKERIYMREVHYLYLFYKLTTPIFRKRLIYVWSRIGEAIFKIISLLAFRASPKQIIHLIGAYIFCLRHLREIKAGNLTFFSQTLGH